MRSYLLFILLSILLATEYSSAITPLRKPEPVTEFFTHTKECDTRKDITIACQAGINYLENVLHLSSSPWPNFRAKYLFLRTHLSPQQEKMLVTGAWNAWVSALDPHAQIISAANSEKESAENHILVNGVGAKLRVLGKRTVIAFVLEKSGGEKAGLRAGDEILEINNLILSKMGAFERETFFQRVKPPVKLLVQREKRVFTKMVNEIQTTLANVDWQLKRDQDGKYLGLLRIHTFTKDDTCTEAQLALETLQNLKVKRIVLDLRDNPGGLVREAQCVAGLLLGPRKIFAKLERQELLTTKMLSYQPLPSSYSSQDRVTLETSGQKLTNLPLEVLINHNTASSAEMLVAALQDGKRASVVGSRSFGKGTMQSLAHPWNDPDLLLSHTTHRILRPSGKTLNLSGVIPDVITEKNEGPNFPREENLTRSL